MTQTLNIELLKQTQEAIKNSPEFYMGLWFHKAGPVCGTAACIAGHIIATKCPKAIYTVGGYVDLLEPGKAVVDVVEVATDMAGLTYDQREWLFYGGYSQHGLNNNSSELAIEAIQHIIDGKPVSTEETFRVYLDSPEEE